LFGVDDPVAASTAAGWTARVRRNRRIRSCAGHRPASDTAHESDRSGPDAQLACGLFPAGRHRL